MEHKISQKAIMATLEELYSNISISTVFDRCAQRLAKANGGMYRVNGNLAYIYYIPKRISKEFAELADLFAKHQVFLEIAVPTIVKCLVGETEKEKLPGLAVWEGSRKTPWKHFTETNMMNYTFLHPTKWRTIQQTKKQMLCTVLTYLHDPHGNMIDINA